MHTIFPHLLRRTIKVAVVGCGGTGGAIVGGLPHLHQALIAGGHPSGLSVTVIDGDRISAANCVRQPFSASEIGLFKSVVLINRMNLFWGLHWQAVPQHLGAGHHLDNDLDLVIGCVDSRAARAKIHDALTTTWCGIAYWLDLGNNADTGQFVLGQPLNRTNRHKAHRLRAVSELFPEIIDPALDDDQQPSCSAAEALADAIILATARMCMIQATCSWAFRTHAHTEILCVCWETAFNRGSSGRPGRLEGRYGTLQL